MKWKDIFILRSIQVEGFKEELDNREGIRIREGGTKVRDKTKRDYGQIVGGRNVKVPGLGSLHTGSIEKNSRGEG